MGFFAPIFSENLKKLGRKRMDFPFFDAVKEYHFYLFLPHETEAASIMAEKQTLEQDLRRLSRKDLIDIIYELRKQEDVLRHELEQARRALEQRDILLEESGSIAEAALKLNGVFEAAQAAADQYLRSVKAAHPAMGGN